MFVWGFFCSLHPSPVSSQLLQGEKKSPLVSGKHPDLELQGQHIHQAPGARTMLHTLICSGDPALAEGTLQRKPHTPISKPRMQGSHQPLLAMLHPQKGFWRTDVLSHCLFLCPALTRSWFCPNMFFFFFALRKVCSLLCRIPSALQSTDWETRTAGKQRGVAQRKGHV